MQAYKFMRFKEAIKNIHTRFAAIFDVPFTLPTSSTNSTPSISSLLLIAITLQIFALAKNVGSVICQVSRMNLGERKVVHAELHNKLSLSN